MNQSLIEYLPLIVFLIILIVGFFTIIIYIKKRAEFLVNYSRKNSYEFLDKEFIKKVKRKKFLFLFKNQFDDISYSYDFSLFNHIFSLGNRILNTFEFSENENKYNIFSYSYSRNRSTYYFKGAIIDLNIEKNIPNLVIQKEDLFNKIFPDINFKENKNFSKMYKLNSEFETETKQFFTLDRLKYFEENELIGDLEISKNSILYLEKGRFSNKDSSYDEFIERAKKLPDYFK